MNIWFLGAGILSFSLCLLHIFGGGKVAARPLLDTDDLNPVAKYTNYYCWHIVTIVIAGLGVMFLFAAYYVSARELAVAASLFALSFSLWNIGLYFWAQKQFRHWYDLAQWLFFLPIWVLGFAGLL